MFSLTRRRFTIFPLALEGHFQGHFNKAEFTMFSTLNSVIFGGPKWDVESGCMIVFDFGNFVNLPQARIESCRMTFKMFSDFWTLSEYLFQGYFQGLAQAVFSRNCP